MAWDQQATAHGVCLLLSLALCVGRCGWLLLRSERTRGVQERRSHARRVASRGEQAAACQTCVPKRSLGTRVSCEICCRDCVGTELRHWPETNGKRGDLCNRGMSLGWSPSSLLWVCRSLRSFATTFTRR